MSLLKIIFLCTLLFAAAIQETVNDFDDDEFTITKTDDAKKLQQVEIDNKEVEELRRLAQRAPESVDQIAKNSSLPPYTIEIIYIVVIILYGLNYWYGSRKNLQIANKWLDSVKDVLENNFTSFAGERMKLTKETSNVFKLICTGRVNTLGMQVTITLRKRHDLLSLILEFFWKSSDEIKIDVALNEEGLDSFVFGLVKSRDAKKFIKANPDLTELSKLVSNDRLSSPSNTLTNFTVYSEFEDVISEILTKEVVNSISSVESSLSEIHISDQNSLSPTYKNSLQVSGRLNEKDQVSENLVKLILYLIDELPQIRLSKPEKQKSEKVRKSKAESKMKETIKERQDALQQKKIEKKQKLIAEMDKLTPEQQRKLEEKLYKQDLKKKQS